MLNRRDLLRSLGALGLASLLPRGARAEASQPFYSAAQLNAALTADPGELDLTLTIEGQLPEALSGGRYLLNGPAGLQVGATLLHPFDGHGYLRSVELHADGSARLRARFLRTAVFEEEEAAGGLVRRGVGSLVAYPGERRWAHKNREANASRNVANTTVVPWAGGLLCGWEGGQPTAVDPDSLAAKGLEDFGGALGEGPFLAHMRSDGDGLVGLSLALGPKSRLTFHELGPDRNERGRQALELEGGSFQHDFALTERYFIVSDNPLRFRGGGALRMLRGRGNMLGAVDAADKDGSLWLVPRAGGAPIRVPLDRPLWAIHHLNAWDEGERVVLVTCAFDDLSFGAEFGYQGHDQPLSPAPLERNSPQRLTRVVIDPATASVVELRELDPRGADFPRVRQDLEGREARVAVAAVRSAPGHSFPFDAVMALDPTDPERAPAIWTPPGGRFMGEPLLAPGEGPQAAWALAMVYDTDARKTSLCVLDPERITDGPIARIEVPELLPYGFHGGWMPAPS